MAGPAPPPSQENGKAAVSRFNSVSRRGRFGLPMRRLKKSTTLPFTETGPKIKN
jgi:hypothetical protein